MSRALWLRLLAVSVAFALLMAGLGMMLMRSAITRPSDYTQRSFYLFIAHLAERQPYAESLMQLKAARAESPAMPFDMWIVDAGNRVQAATTGEAPPPRLLAAPRPQQVHDLLMRGHFFSGAGAAVVVRLDTPEPSWLLLRNQATGTFGTFRTIGWLFGASMLGAILLGLALVTLYLRGHAAQASKVIADIEAGKLGARFAVGRLDEAGGLMLQFNRMADRLQGLLEQLRTTDRTRRELLQELGHDLRTPLTSLRTALDTLAAHGEAMAPSERQEFLRLAGSELLYFSKLIDDLFFIAEIEGPQDQARRLAPVDLAVLAASEMQAAQSGHRNADAHLSFTLQQPDAACHIGGDAHLLSRLLRNLYDNAARHAKSQVHTSLSCDGRTVELNVHDDGTGMPAEAIARYGLRRSQRLQLDAGHGHPSLGLGSVIIKTIVELHGGTLAISSGAVQAGLQGTRLTLRFPVAD
jgi:signal transduction histidine kinase